MKISKAFYQRSGLEVAPDLLGLSLVHNTKDGILKGRKLIDFCNGPGKLCSAMGITKEHNGIDLTGDELYLERPKEKELFTIEKSKRINIDYAGEAKDYLWRFTITDSPFLSVR